MIRFEIAGEKFKIRKIRLKKRWINYIAKNEGYDIDSLAVIFCDDPFLLEINRKYLNHNYFTDTITFNYADTDLIFGDVYISTDRVFENAKKFGVVSEEELLRVIAHGTLHLCGYMDHDDQNREIMKKKEDFYISKYKEYQEGTV